MTATVIAGRGIVTPQGVVLDLEPAGLGHRGLSRIVDSLLSVVMLTIIVMIGDLLAIPSVGETLGYIFILVMAFLWFFGYPIVSETFFRGRTLGKMVLGLRVVTLEAGPVGLRHAFIRSMFQIIDIFASVGSVAILSGMCTSRSQRLGDVAAGTFVIIDPQVVSHIPAVAFTPPIGTQHIVAAMDVSKLRPDQERLIRSFLLRVAELSGASRADIGNRLAESTSRFLGHEGQFGMASEVYLVSVLAARQLREGGLAQLVIR